MTALRDRTQGRFRRDVLWNFGSIAVLGVSGLALMVLIGRVYGAAVLGVFSLVTATYIVFSQAAVAGIDRSVLRATAEHTDDRPLVTTIVLAAIWPTLLLAAISTAVFYFARGPISVLVKSPGVAVGVVWATPGLFFFAINKVLLAVVNGVRRMRAFAVLNALRYVLILAGLFVAIALDFPGHRLAFVYTFAEALLFVPLAVEVGRQMVRPRAGAAGNWSLEHLRYGIKSSVSGMLLELNAKVDVWMVGFFLTDARVGIYYFAAQLAEGVFQPLVVLQNNYNPLLARHIVAHRDAELHVMVAKGKRATYLLMALVCGLAVAVYPVYVMLTGKSDEFLDSWLPFGVLMAGMFAASGYMPFAQTLLMANRPGWHTLMMIGIVAVNAIANYLLIPRFDIVGAAMGTAISLLSSVVFLVAMVRWRVGVRL